MQHQSLLENLAAALGEKLAKKYRVAPDKATAMILGYWSGAAPLQALCTAAEHAKAVTRTRIYKDAARDATRKIYYDLRRYHDQSSDSLLMTLQQTQDQQIIHECLHALVQNHVSTAERWPHLAQFWSEVEGIWSAPKSILDVGCGLMPMLYPFDRLPLTKYLALDRSEECISALQVYQALFQPEVLEAQVWDIAHGWPDQSLYYDVALMLKLVPVVARQAPEQLEILANVPARQLIVTGCKQAMVKQQSIERRERACIVHFAQAHDFQIVKTFETPDEIGLLLEKM